MTGGDTHHYTIEDGAGVGHVPFEYLHEKLLKKHVLQTELHLRLDTRKLIQISWLTCFLQPMIEFPVFFLFKLFVETKFPSSYYALLFFTLFIANFDYFTQNGIAPSED